LGKQSNIRHAQAQWTKPDEGVPIFVQDNCPKHRRSGQNQMEYVFFDENQMEYVIAYFSEV
jgi:hypothetical protein